MINNVLKYSSTVIKVLEIIKIILLALLIVLAVCEIILAVVVGFFLCVWVHYTDYLLIVDESWHRGLGANFVGFITLITTVK